MICKFEELYQQEAQGQRARYQALREGFKAQFGSDEGGEYFSAPGRSEIGGTRDLVSPTTSMAACWPPR